MPVQVFESKQSRATFLNIVFAGAIVAVAAAIVLTIGHCIDSLQKNSTAVQKIKPKDYSRIFSSLPKSEIDSQLDRLAVKDERKAREKEAKARPLAGSELIFAAGIKAARHGNFQQAAKLYSQVLAAIPAEARTKSMWVCWKNNACERDKFMSVTYQGRAACYLQTKQFQAAVQDLNQAIKLRPEHAENYRTRSIAYRQLGKTTLAEADQKTFEHLSLLDREHKANLLDRALIKRSLKTGMDP